LNVAALLIVQATVLHKDRYRKYQAAVQPLIQSCGGRLRATGAELEVLEGSPPGRRLVIFEFPSMDALQAFWRSPQYAAIKPLREGAAQIDAWAVPAG
jgi:uncharacterized protein (DUF1330 family)